MSLTILHDVLLAPLTTFKVGGSASHFVEVNSEEDLLEAVRYAKAQGLRAILLGGGSNMLIADEGLNALVIKVALRGVHTEAQGDTILVHAGAGETLDDVIAYTVQEGWWGIENLSHIPGTVGATPVQNVGAYGVEAQDVIISVRVLNMDTDTFEELSPESCHFGYRDSIFKHEGGTHYAITRVTYKLSTVPNPQITYRDLALAFEGKVPTLREIREEVVKIRAGKFPDWRSVGTAGSFFKNPIITVAAFEVLAGKYPQMPSFRMDDGMVKVPLGWILDKVLQLRGVVRGNVEAYQNQALVIVAREGATASEIEAFAQSIADDVRKETGIAIEWEVTKLG